MSNLNPDDGFSKNALNFVPGGIEDDRTDDPRPNNQKEWARIHDENMAADKNFDSKLDREAADALEALEDDRNLEPKLPASDPWAPAEPEPNMWGDHSAGPDNPDEGDHQSKLDGRDTSANRIPADKIQSLNLTSSREKVHTKLADRGQALLDAAFEIDEWEQSDMFKRMKALGDNPSNGALANLFEEMRQAEGGIGGMATFIMKTLDLTAKRNAAESAYFEYRRMAMDMGLI